MGISFFAFADEIQKIASRRWRKAIETGEIGAREIETLLEPRFGSTHLPWHMRPYVRPGKPPVPVPNVLERYSPYEKGEMIIESLSKRPVSTESQARDVSEVAYQALHSMKRDPKGGPLLDEWRKAQQAAKVKREAEAAAADEAIRKRNASIPAVPTTGNGGGVNPALVAGGIGAGALALGGGGLAIHHLMKRQRRPQ